VQYNTTIVPFLSSAVTSEGDWDAAAVAFVVNTTWANGSYLPPSSLPIQMQVVGVGALNKPHGPCSFESGDAAASCLWACSHVGEVCVYRANLTLTARDRHIPYEYRVLTGNSETVASTNFQLCTSRQIPLPAPTASPTSVGSALLAPYWT
jgi:hypothetical protein